MIKCVSDLIAEFCDFIGCLWVVINKFYRRSGQMQCVLYQALFRCRVCLHFVGSDVGDKQEIVSADLSIILAPPHACMTQQEIRMLIVRLLVHIMVSVWSSDHLVIRGLVKKKKKNEEKDNDVNMCVEEGRTRPAGIDLGSLAVYLILDTVCCACVFLHLLQS